MAKKRHHMTKHEYTTTSHSKNRRGSGRRTWDTVDFEPQEFRQRRTEYAKDHRRSDTEMRQYLREIRKFPGELLETEDAE